MPCFVIAMIMFIFMFKNTIWMEDTWPTLQTQLTYLQCI